MPVQQTDIVSAGLELMLYGMGTVIVFLTLLVLATILMSRLVGRFFPEPEIRPTPARQAFGAPAPAQDKQLMAVIAAAIHKHRSRR